MRSPVVLTKGNNTTEPLMGLAQLMSRVFKGDNLTLIGKQLLTRSYRDDAEALLDLSVLLQLQHQKEAGLALQHEALKQQQVYNLTPTNITTSIKLLAIYTSGDLMTNTPLEFIAEGAGFELQILYIADGIPQAQVIPEHDIAIVALSELDRNAAALHQIEGLLPRLNCPILNLPAKIKGLARDSISHTLQDIDGIEIPQTFRRSKQTLLSLDAQQTLSESLQLAINFPIIIRPVDSHAGINLAKINSHQQLRHYLHSATAANFFIAPFHDYKSSDGQYRKYRIMLIDGKPFIAHMATSDDWMIHYLNAGMLECATKRFSEAQLMGNFEQSFARHHQRALSQLSQAVDLEYFGIDCAETKDGKLLIFEACASLNIHAMDCEQTFPYKKAQMQKIFDAFLQMLMDKVNNKAPQ
ncbi:MAG: RimK family alpha-L-glutamate ligase [Oceanospirillaceae bacterium]|nr:RimK family alpha-L-glutamate ligase [Oceanospirillaceae bacterium]